MRLWAKTRENGEYHSTNIAHAVFGFKELGAEIIKYNTIDEIYDKVQRDDIVLDYINQSLTIFDKFGVHPELPDYPDVLKPYLGRKIWKDTIDSINSNPDKWGIFVKPVKDKAFTGKVIRNTKDLIGCGSCYENYDVYCSDVVDIQREWRGFIYYDKLIDLRPYNGDWHHTYNSLIIDEIMDAFIQWEDRPMACSLDFAVISRKIKRLRNGMYVTVPETIFLEANDAYALGNYGLNHVLYAKMISARWSQLLGTKDEYKF